MKPIPFQRNFALESTAARLGIIARAAPFDPFDIPGKGFRGARREPGVARGNDFRDILHDIIFLIERRAIRVPAGVVPLADAYGFPNVRRIAAGW